MLQKISEHGIMTGNGYGDDSRLHWCWLAAPPLIQFFHEMAPFMTGIEYHLNMLLMGYHGTHDKTVTQENVLKEAVSLPNAIPIKNIPYS